MISFSRPFWASECSKTEVFSRPSTEKGSVASAKKSAKRAFVSGSSARKWVFKKRIFEVSMGAYLSKRCTRVEGENTGIAQQSRFAGGFTQSRLNRLSEMVRWLIAISVFIGSNRRGVTTHVF